jgi:retinol-binding protein 3
MKMPNFTGSKRGQPDLWAFVRDTLRLSIMTLAVAIALNQAGQAQQPQAKPPDIDAKTQLLIIDSVTTALDSNYVFPEKAKLMSKFAREQYKKGAYKNMTAVDAFTQKLGEDLFSVCKDKHFGVRYMEGQPNQLRDPDSMTQAERDQILDEQRRNNYGFYKLEHLDGNVGYVDLRQFADARYAGATAVAAMNFLGNSDALIFDLRQNGGGDPSMIQLLTSYLFSEPRHINSFYIRGKDTLDQFWTQAYVPGRKMPDVPVYILTSGYTFSAAEEFTYNLKNMKRATIVGENTGGGAHPVMDVYFASLKVAVRVPFGRAVNPITGTNWEGVGIAPDIAVPQQQALTAAHTDALKKIAAGTTDTQRKQQLIWVSETLGALAQPAKIDAVTLQKYAGKYGPRTISLEGGDLYYQREGRPKFKMTPLAPDTFVFDDMRQFRIKFVSDAQGRVTGLSGVYDDGHQDNSPKTSD